MSPLGRCLALVAGAFAALAATAADARADDDGAYGRLDGDFGLELGAGLAAAKQGPELAAEAAGMYLGTAGVYARYLDALGGDESGYARSIAAGIVFRPLFLARFAKDMEHGPARLDLLVDSIGLELGAWYAVPHGSSGFARDPGLELALGIDVPFFADTSGPWVGVRAGLRVAPPTLEDQPREPLLDQGAFLSFTLGWHQLIGTMLSDAGDALAP